MYLPFILVLLALTTVASAVVPTVTPKTDYDQALAYQKGDGVEQDVTKAFGLFLQSAQSGDPRAEYKVGLAYYIGEGVTKDQIEGLAWMYKAVSLGMPKSVCSTMEASFNDKEISSIKERSKEIGITIKDVKVDPEAAPTDTNTLAMDMGPIAATVARMLEQGHYLHPLSLSEKNPPRLESEPQRTMSERVLINYFNMLDCNHLYLTKGDIDEFMARFSPALATDILHGDLSAPHTIFKRFRQRVGERVAKNKELAAEPHDFSSNKMVQINRKNAPWPVDSTEADKLWADRIEADLLQEHLNEHPINTPDKVVTKRYALFLKSTDEQSEKDVIKTFLDALAKSYDPHSEYIGSSEMRNWSQQMQASFVGIGMVLLSDDGYAKIFELVPGGPADKDGRLRVNDRIVAVAQGEEAFEDVVNMKLDSVVEKLRGAKGSQVRLQVIPANTTDPSRRTVVEITRDSLQQEASESNGEVIDSRDDAGKIVKVGWLRVPKFYNSEMNHPAGQRGASTTKDVRRIVERMKKEGIEGLVIDLRGNGGGSLEESINLPGLFVGSGPLVQAKDSNGKVSVNDANEGEPCYKGPVVVLINRRSAGSSEIFAAALQDYGRAVVVGDQNSFGYGTVQTLLDVGKFMPLFRQQAEAAGSLKLTIQKFYRVTGASTQLRGVLSDIVIPSTTDTPDIGESALVNPLFYDEVDAQHINKFSVTTSFITSLRQHSLERVAKDREFQFINEDVKIRRQKLDQNLLSLNEKIRREELALERKRKDERNVELNKNPESEPMTYQVTLDTVDNPLLPIIKKHKTTTKEIAAIVPNAANEDHSVDVMETRDPIRVEALNILKEMTAIR